jgi:ADP-heptose:LPS heptosyltransferase
MPTTNRLVLIHPGASGPDKRWPADCFARVADRLAADGFRIAITGNEDERRLCDDVAGMMQYPAAVLAGRTSLGTLAAVVASAELVICNDTGVSHLAEAVGTCTVVLFTATDPARWAPKDPMRHRAVTPPELHDVHHVLSKARQLLPEVSVVA